MGSKVLRYIRSNILVIKKHEMKKFIPLFLICNLITFNVLMLRMMKDALIVAQAGADSMPIAKIIMFGCAFVMLFLTTKLFDYLSTRRVFSIFIAVFTFAFFILMFFLNTNMKWPSIVFYVISDLFRTVVYGATMWVFFNDVCSVNEGKRFYFLIVGSQFGAILASSFPKFFGRFFSKEILFQVSLSLVIFVGIFTIFLIHRSRDVFIKTEEEIEKTEKKKKDKGGILEGLKIVGSSWYIFLILLITFSYNFVMPMADYIWKKNLESSFVSKEDLFLYNADYTFITSLLTVFLVLFVSSGLMKRFNLGVSLSMFPLVFVSATFIYFFLMPIPAGGVLMSILIKSGKYAFSDSSSQILYIPCEPSEKHKAKPVIDIIGARSATFLSSIFNRYVLATLGGFESIVKFGYPVIALICVIWFFAATRLGKMFNRKVREQTKDNVQVQEEIF